MKIFRTVEQLSTHIAEQKQQGKIIGFVPTMGALHNGHLSLLKCSLNRGLYSVVSIFVNPTQFNDAQDLEKYPRTEDTDFSLLEKNGANVIFAPSVDEIYTKGIDFSVNIEYGMVDKVMEGKHRPGHFAGVASVVKRLFEIVQPHVSFFGKKDFQQIAVIRLLNQQIFKNKIEIVACDIMREDDGLAMSSRNMRLNKKQRQEAPLIAQTLKEATRKTKMHTVEDVKKWVTLTIERNSDMKVEYFDIVSPGDLLNIKNWNETKNPVGCIAVQVGEIRLIDNITF